MRSWHAGAVALALALSLGSSGAHAQTFCAVPDSVGVVLTFFDVGQGDATLIESANGMRALVDGGPAASLITRLLDSLGVDRLELVVATHNHLDHIGGLPTLLRRVPVAVVIENGLPASTAVYRRFAIAKQASRARELPPLGQLLPLGDVTLRILPPTLAELTQNDRSVGVLVQRGEFRALLTGDAEVRALESWLLHDSIPRVTVLQASHHGSSNGVTPAWGARTEPSIVVISVGRRNRYGHPSPDVLAFWTRDARRVLRTDMHGTVRIRGCRDGSYRLRTAIFADSLVAEGYALGLAAARQPKATSNNSRAALRVRGSPIRSASTSVSRRYVSGDVSGSRVARA